MGRRRLGVRSPERRCGEQERTGARSMCGSCPRREVSGRAEHQITCHGGAEESETFALFGNAISVLILYFVSIIRRV
ncbi:hypothetical protein Mapa_004728 [Marchantia paleacea]|nr:hypothetical protein Mapa_004728 [Marchantia paleacea]